MKNKIIILLLCFLIIFLIYEFTYEEKIDYLALGDGLALGQTYYGTVGFGYADYIADYLKKEKCLSHFEKNFAKKELTTKELINEIKHNDYIIKDGKTLNINKAIADSEIITLSIGNNEISDINKYIKNKEEARQKINKVFIELEEVINLIRDYNKYAKLYVIGYYSYGKENNDEIIEYTDKKFEKIEKKINFNFIKISDLFKNNIKFLPNTLENYPSNIGYKEISKRVMNKLIL